MQTINNNQDDRFIGICLKFLFRFLKEKNEERNIAPKIDSYLAKLSKPLTIETISTIFNTALDWSTHPKGGDYMYRLYIEFLLLMFVVNLSYGKEQYHNMLYKKFKRGVTAESIPSDWEQKWWKETECFLQCYAELSYLQSRTKFLS